MSVNITQNADGSMGLQGSGLLDQGGFLAVHMRYDAASVDGSYGVFHRPMRVKNIIGVPTVAGTDGGAVTAIVKKVSSGTAITSGTALHTSTINLKGTADTNQVMTLSATDSALTIAAGDRIGLDFTGTLTAATGVVTVWLCPV